MKVAFITRATLYKVHGGGGVQIIETAKYLQKLGIKVNIYLTNEKISYEEFDLLHFFDIIRPANILYHIKKTNKPFVISPILVNYSEYDSQYRKGISGLIFRSFSASANEYIKTILRWILRKDVLQSKAYIWKGHKKSIKEILQKVNTILPNSKAEYEQLKKLYSTYKPYIIVPNGIDEKLFYADSSFVKDEKLIICAARIEGIKNQLNLIKALNNTDFRLLLIGEAAPNQKDYYRRCRKMAAKNVEFIGRVSQQELVGYYNKAKVHALPSWFETCGLSSLEAAAMGCNIVITEKGYTRDYFGNDAFYCDPETAGSIYHAVSRAAESVHTKKLQEKILQQYTWQRTAAITFEAYKKIINALKATQV